MFIVEQPEFFKFPGAVEAMAYLTAIEKDSMPSVPLPQPPVTKNILPPPPLPSLMSDIPINEALGLRDMVMADLDYLSKIKPEPLIITQIFTLGCIEMRAERNHFCTDHSTKIFRGQAHLQGWQFSGLYGQERYFCFQR